MSENVRKCQEMSSDLEILSRRISDDIATLRARAEAAERGYQAACGELEHVLGGLPFASARTGKYRKLRRRLEHFLSDRLEGL